MHPHFEPNPIQASQRDAAAFLLPQNVSMEGTMLYQQYYRDAGVRRAVQLVAPTLLPIEKLVLPRNSLLHFVSTDESLYGIPQDDPILHSETRPPIVEHITQLAGELGTPRPTRIAPSGMVRDYHQRYRRMKRLLSLDSAARDVTTLIVENYALLAHLYRYTPTFFAGYNKWSNIQTTVWTNAQRLYEAVPQREQFIECRLPKQLPTLQQLIRAELTLNRTMLTQFSEPSALFILEVWKWFGDTREQSVLSKLSPAALSKINLVWIESGQWFVMNLGLVDTWRKTGEHSKATITPAQMQRRFLRLLMYLFEARTVAGHDVLGPVKDEKVTPGQGDAIAATTATPVSVKIKVEAGDHGGARTLTLKPGLNIDLLPEHPIEETEANVQQIDEAITKDLEALDHRIPSIGETDDEVKIVEHDKPVPSELAEPISYQAKERTLASSIMAKVDAEADRGTYSGAEYRRMQALSTAYERLPDPYGTDKPMAQAMQVRYEDLKIRKTIAVPDQKTVMDKSMLNSSLFDFDKRYIEEVMPRDVVRSVVALQHGGVAITGYQIEEVEDALGHYESHSVQLTPVRGKPSTVHFRLPKVQADGTYRSNGVRYRLRKQRSDLPIRKLSSSRVALTSYYAKTFVNRSEKQIHNYSGWLTNKITAAGMDTNNEEVSNILLASVYNTYDVVPRIYSVLGSRLRSFKLRDMEFFLDYQARKDKYGAERVEAAEQNKLTVIGNIGKDLMVVDATDTLYRLKGEEVVELGKFETLMGLSGRQPMEMVEVKVLNKSLPIGVVMAYMLGLDELLKVLNLRPRRVPAGERLNMNEDEFALRFEDEALVFSRDNKLASMILSGFQTYDDSIRNYPVHLFNKKDIFLNILEQNRIGLRYLRELDLMQDLFIDPITETILQKMGEPTDFIGLLIRSCELLLTDWAPAETDMEFMRSRGYERMAGAVYSEMVRSIRAQRSKGSVANAKIELAPYAVWQLIQQDPAVKLVEESNPVHNLKEKEEITFSGVGGRSGRSMVKRTRVFHLNDTGVISEATKDSGDVAITTFLTADPNLTDLYGLTRRYNPETDGPASLLSSSALLAPAADRDDPKRVNFISIQQSAGTFAKGYQVSPLRTGYEQIVAHRTDDLFAATAAKKGKVSKINNRAIVVTYEDGSTYSVQLGRRFGTAAGSMFPHELVTALKVDDEVNEGDCLAYNSRYFALDPLNKRQALLKSGILVKTALMDSPDTLEDASTISQEVADQMETQLAKPRDIVVSFKETVHNLVTVGETVDVENILCVIEDPVTAQNNLFGDSSKDTLRLIAANAPKAKFKGVVEKIEVFYHGDIDDLSPSLQSIAEQSDLERKREARDLGKKYTTGRVDEGLRIDNRSLPFEHVAIRVYITGNVSAGVGDKGVFGNQLKTVHSRVMSGTNETESGVKLGAIFGGQSVDDRIVESPIIMGTANTLLIQISQRVVAAYKGSKS